MKLSRVLAMSSLACLLLAPAAVAGGSQRAQPGKPSPAVQKVREAALPHLRAARQAINHATETLSFSFGVVERGDPHEAVARLAQAQRQLRIAIRQIQAARMACATGQH